MRPPTSRRLLTAVPALLLTAVAVAACGSSSGSAAGSGPSLVPAVTTVPVTPSGDPATSPAVSSPPASSASTGDGRCHTAGLTAALGQSEGAAGHIFAVVTLTNSTSASCTLFGFPGMALQDAAGTALATTVTRNGGQLPSQAPGSLTLAAGAVASFSVSWSDVPTGAQTCPASTSALVTPPDETTSLTVPLKAGACGGELDVSPVVTGTTGVAP